MDKRAAEQYLNRLFGSRAGHVAVAYKNGQVWQENQFEWPGGKGRLLSWAEDNSAGDIFICPALRTGGLTRRKGDMQPTTWLWADVDWQTIPADKRADVHTRIKEIGTYVVASGSGDNAHVYVQLTEPVDHTEFIRLNTGLRDYLYGDNKQADNSLLRLPGTTNHKNGVVVVERGGHGRRMTSASLMRRRAFKDVKIAPDADASDWSFVELDGLPRRVRGMVEMSVEDAELKYGSRFKAVWAVTGELHKRGFDEDAIHSLMDKFPPALDKMAEENGYDVHKDVDKRLAYSRVAEKHDDNDDEMEDIDDDAYQRSIDAETDEEIQRWAELEYKRSQARKRAKQLEAERGWVSPPSDVSWSLYDVLNAPPQPAQYLIGIPPNSRRGLCGVKHNVIITAQFKTGKTKFTIASIAKSLCDGAPFLGSIPVHTPEGGVVVGHWNCEMDAEEMASDYVIPAGFINVKNLRGANLRGYRVNILSAMGRQWAVRWLRGEIQNHDGSYPAPVKVWTIDSLARLARMAGVSEKDNDEMFDLLMALDEVKVEAGVDVIFLITHTGRMQHEEGKERARGATAIDDWCDARWIMTEQSGIRFLAVDGRGVGMDTSSLDYDEVTGTSTLGGLSKADSVSHGWEQVALKIVVDAGEGVSERALIAKMVEAAKLTGRRLGKETARAHVREAVENGFIEKKREPGPQGPLVWNHYPVAKPKDDRNRKGTPRVVNLAPLQRH